MADTDDLLRDIASEEFQHGVRHRFWRLVDQSESVAYLTLYAPDDREYLVELDCKGYGKQPILGRFVDPETRKCVASAWPKGNSAFAQWVKFEGTDLFICWTKDREGVTRHPEWKEVRAWTKDKNQLVAYLEFLRRLLHLKVNGYQNHGLLNTAS